MNNIINFLNKKIVCNSIRSNIINTLDSMSDNFKNNERLKNDYLYYLENQEKYKTLLYKYKIGVKKDEKELIKKIANRVGLKIND